MTVNKQRVRTASKAVAVAKLEDLLGQPCLVFPDIKSIRRRTA
jgi:hypothetical protein